MQRRTLIHGATGAAIALMVLTGCTTNKGSEMSAAEKKAEIDKDSDAALATLYSSVPGSREMASSARGILVFPKVLAAGFGVGGEYGNGALRIGGRTVDYYRTTSVSFGFQAGAQSKAIIFMFMTQEALDKFRTGSGWTAGADASVAVMRTGANATVDLKSVTSEVAAFALSNAGLMASATIDGTKVKKLDF
jgi:lipid-binding SYLF domain-containing protein